MTSTEIGKRCGWVYLPAEVDRVVASFALPVFADAAPHLRGSGAGKDVFHWQAEQKLLGKVLTSWDQLQVGTCVSFGWGRGGQDLMIMDIALSDEPEEIPEDVKGNADHRLVATEPIYGGSRVEIGGGRISGDGSVGAWAADWVVKFGMLFAKKYGTHDLTRYSESRSRDWGRRGVPDELEPLTKEHPVKTTSLVRTYEQARDAICNLYPVPVCSGQGFTSTRDASGLCHPRGSWAHCMLFRGACVLKGNRPVLICQNSWGGYLSGPDKLTLESGAEVILPQGCFGVEAEVANRMLREGESYAMSGFVGFPARRVPMDWTTLWT